MLDNKANIADLLEKEPLSKENALVERILRSKKAELPVEYEFTSDRALLHQYYHLREIMYRKVFKTQRFDGKEDVHDKISHILIAKQGKLCIGGCRLTVREVDEEFNLPMETDGFVLRDALEADGYCKVRHAEISRFAISSDKYQREVMYSLVKIALEKAVELNVGYTFVKSMPVMMRNWSNIAGSLAYNKKVLRHIKVPENPIHPGVNWYIGMVEMPGVESLAKSQNVENELAYLTTMQ